MTNAKLPSYGEMEARVVSQVQTRWKALLEVPYDFEFWNPHEEREEAESLDEAYRGMLTIPPPEDPPNRAVPPKGRVARDWCRSLVERAKRIRNGIALSMPQLGMNVNVCVIKNISDDTLRGVKKGEWLWVADLHAGHLDGPRDTIDHRCSIPNFPKVKTVIPVSDRVDVTCFILNAKDGEGEEFTTVVDGALALPFQFMAHVMRGDSFDVVERDIDTVRRGEDDKKVGANEACPCGSSKKHKRCCGRV